MENIEWKLLTKVTKYKTSPWNVPSTLLEQRVQYVDHRTNKLATLCTRDYDNIEV